MSVSALTLMTLGFLFILGLVADLIGRNTPIPRVSALLVFGIIIGPSGFDLLPVAIEHWMPVVSDIALASIGFLLGNSFNISRIHSSGKAVLSISIFVALATTAVVSSGLWLAGVSLPVALICGGIAPATDPASTVDVISESKSEGEFSETLLKITAIDDAWGLIIFSLMFAAAQIEMLDGGGLHTLLDGFSEVLVSVLLGVALGVPMSFLTGRILPGEPSLVEGLGMVFICSGCALWIGASYLLSAMVMGAVVANLARHHERPFCAIEGVEWPLLVIFFIFAGVCVRREFFWSNILLIVFYILLRVASRFVGTYGGALIAGKTGRFGGWMGMALMPQAGIALGMALTAANRFEEFQVVVSVIAATTVFFEIAGPICTRFALKMMGDINTGERHKKDDEGCSF
ncbi:cation:proton antiporter [Maridesulfovibrio sp.]|uniref:cation:proton antiporter n=1 Tax=Maridesulfovibrio sp. TaxID=2795000 RepID=UPI0029C9B7BB|nr:cation:proton antiporter [Maridesulfovibrio sp.]